MNRSNRTVRVVLSGFWALTLFLGCRPAADGELTVAHRSALADTIRTRMLGLAEAISARDSAAITTFRDDSVLVSVAGGHVSLPPAPGLAQAVAFFRTLRTARFHWDSITVDVVSPTIVLSAGSWTFTATDTTGADRRVVGAETYVWQRARDGAWRLRQQHESYLR